jgi:hypothetical protein
MLAALLSYILALVISAPTPFFSFQSHVCSHQDLLHWRCTLPPALPPALTLL